MPTISMFYGILIRMFFNDIEYQGPMRIANVDALPDWTLVVTTTDGRVGQFDMLPYLCYEAFEELKDSTEFMKISNGGYFVEWQCGADLSADTIEAKMYNQ